MSSYEEKRRVGIERHARMLHQANQKKGNYKTTYEQALKASREVADYADRKKGK